MFVECDSKIFQRQSIKILEYLKTSVQNHSTHFLIILFGEYLGNCFVCEIIANISSVQKFEKNYTILFLNQCLWTFEVIDKSKKTRINIMKKNENAIHKHCKQSEKHLLLWTKRATPSFPGFLSKSTWNAKFKNLIWVNDY